MNIKLEDNVISIDNNLLSNKELVMYIINQDIKFNKLLHLFNDLNSGKLKRTYKNVTANDLSCDII